MSLPVALTQDAKSAATVRLGTVQIFFSYESCVGFRDSRGPAMLNPACVGLSVTTSKHISGFGLKGSPVADSEAAFGLALSRAVGGACMVMGWNAEDNVRPAPTGLRGEILAHPPADFPRPLPLVTLQRADPATWDGGAVKGWRDRMGGILIRHDDGAETYLQPGDDANDLADTLDSPKITADNIGALLCDMLEGVDS